MLFATRCPVCDARGPAPCPACAAELRPAPALPPPPGLDRCAAVLIYAGTGRELVARLKYRNRRAPLDRLAAAMAERVLAEPDFVTWAPTTRSRWRRRGYDQAELLARAVAGRLGRPCRRLLVRLPGPAQTGLSLTQRRVAPVFRATTAPPPRVLVVDDVVTSGATLSAAARALRAAGAAEVDAVVAARTPLKRAFVPADTPRSA